MKSEQKKDRYGCVMLQQMEKSELFETLMTRFAGNSIPKANKTI